MTTPELTDDERELLRLWRLLKPIHQRLTLAQVKYVAEHDPAGHEQGA